MTLENILAKVEEFSADRDYWFMRTDYGKNFDEFYNNEYIAIGWDYLTVNDILNKSESEIKNIIARREDLDLTNSRKKGKATLIYNRIKTFFALKRGDIVIIPSRNSNRLSFGEIIDEHVYEDSVEIESGEYFKRRKIKWLEEPKSIHTLDPIFYQLKTNQHTISNVNKYAPYIDKVIGNLFQKGDNTHYVLDIETRDDVNFNDLSNLMENIQGLVNNINSELSLDENTERFFVKINLQSPGKLEMIKPGKKCLAILAFLLYSCNGNESDINDPRIKNLRENNQELLNETQVIMDSLDVNYDNLVKPFR